MATKTDGHMFTHPRSKYPWRQWTDGDQWVIHKDEDYSISTYNMQISLHGRAKTQHLRVRSNSFTNRVSNNDGSVTTREGLVFQFYKEGTHE